MAHELSPGLGHWNRTATAVGSSLPPPRARPPNEKAGDSQLTQRAGLRRPPKGVDLSQNSLSLSLSLSRWLACLLACLLAWGQDPRPEGQPLHGPRLCLLRPRFGVLRVCSLQSSTVNPPPTNTPAKTFLGPPHCLLRRSPNKAPLCKGVWGVPVHEKTVGTPDIKPVCS